MPEKEWTDEYRSFVRMRLFQIIAWVNQMFKLPLSEAQKKYPESKITEEKGFQGEQAVICRRYINPFGGEGWRVFNA